MPKIKVLETLELTSCTICICQSSDKITVDVYDKDTGELKNNIECKTLKDAEYLINRINQVKD